MNRRNLLAAALGLPLAPLAAIAAPMACIRSPLWLRNAYQGVPPYEFNYHLPQGGEFRAIFLNQTDAAGGRISLFLRDGELVWEAVQ